MTWWERYPSRLGAEFRALEEAEIPYKRDEEALARGLMRLNLRIRTPPDGAEIPLVVTYPELFPYFRIEVQAPTLNLMHHQNPFHHNLCLLRRSTFFWNIDDTAASVLQSQFGTVLSAGRSETAPPEGTEQRQGEPLAEFYPYDLPSMILIEGDQQIDPAHRSGVLRVRLATPESPVIRGIVAEVQDNTGHILSKASEQLKGVFSGGPTIRSRWIRADAGVRLADSRQFFEHIEKRDLGRADNRPSPYAKGFVRIWGILFPDELQYRSTAYNWVFVCELSPNVRPPATPTVKGKGR